MSTMDSSLYRQHIGGRTHHHGVRPVVIGAPYVLCGFAVGVILMAVGTFVTSHAYSDEKKDPVLLGVGPGLLGLGALLLLSAVLICIVACLRNRQLREAFSDDLFTIGASTFYGGHQFVQLEDDQHLPDHYSPRGSRRRHSTSGGASDPSEAVKLCPPRILANTVAEERQRQRKNSRKLPRNRSYENETPVCYTGPQGLVELLGREEQDHLGLERIRRVQPHPELAQDFDLGDSDYSSHGIRDRSYSMSVRRPGKQFPPVEHRLRRNLTYTQASRARQQLQRQQQLAVAGPHLPGWEAKQPRPQRKRSSRKRKPNAAEVKDGPLVHQLPKYDPDLLRVLGIESNRPVLNRGLSEDTRQTPGATAAPGWQDDPDVTHGSLGNPRRRPAVAMGVRGIRPKQSGAAYRHASSIYASDMELHRSEAAMTSDASQPGHEPRDMQSPGVTGQYFSLAGTVNRNLGSSPTLQSPYAYGDSSPQLDRRRESPVPSSTPSLSHGHGRRPLSNISSASESCCSECCQDGQDGAKGEHHHHQARRTSTTTEGGANPNADQRPQNSDA
ncbi:uncharacterized protein LOC126998755 isoform X1 [Eriocheir sinensis]|uniref:uncharacterized protein LOC126998755 isoform X1 n=1 Tax=Eriocheir sinensis TaxID=95602 RepID=UPI0021C8B14C|nr:uncharacterized protein LOC126998755 isoform X1 [Eriocheir sinensis]